MWQVQITFKDEIEKERIILSSYLCSTQGIQEWENNLLIFFDNERNLKKFKETLENKEFFIERISNRINWLRRWKRFHKIVKIKPFIIVPAFKKFVDIPEGYKKIIINPSFAFGTGSHPTTKMCIMFLREIVKKGCSVLDLGCGTGILAICSEKLGASEIFAVDIDEIALKETEKNIKKNKCKKIECSQVIPSNKDFDIVVCNILYNTILELKGEIEKAIKRNGKLVLSGILHNQAEDIIDAYSSNFKLLKSKKMSDKNYLWVSFLFEKI